jgi:hypothetical protein
MVFDEISLSIRNDDFNFSYFRTKPPQWFGGLQCNFEHDSKEYKELETKLVNLAETILKEIKEI